MGGVRSVAILLHERPIAARVKDYRVSLMAQVWERDGVKVQWLRGPREGRRAVESQVLIPHIDLSYYPDAYWEVVEAHPCAINRHVRDIRKRAYSTLLVGRGDAWDGPVIVKTDANSGGYSEEKCQGPEPRRAPGKWAQWWERWRHSERTERWLLGGARRLNHYHVFESWRRVPRGVWKNPLLVVERFVPERLEQGYAVRMTTCLGDKVQSRLMVSPYPVVKSRDATLKEFIATPPEALEWRRRLRVDYAKLDWVVHEGRPVLLDVNITPSMSLDGTESQLQRARYMASGLGYYGDGPGAAWGVACQDKITTLAPTGRSGLSSGCVTADRMGLE